MEDIELQVTIPELGYNMKIKLPEDIISQVVTELNTISFNMLRDRWSQAQEEQEATVSQPPRRYRLDKKMVRSNPFTHEMFKSSRVVTMECPHCGKITMRRLTLSEDNITHCHWCRSDIELRTIAKTVVSCPNCSSDKYMAWVANGGDRVACKDCNSIVDIVYDEDNLKARTWNLEMESSMSDRSGGHTV